MRTFIAVPLPAECRTRLEALQKEMRAFGAEVRWTATSSIHLTLKFLGEIDPAILPKLKDSVGNAVSGPPFGLCLRGLGGFPGLRNPRVLWCGLEGELPRLARLQADVEKACAGLGFEPESRAFQPHLTLGRVQGKRNLQPLLDYIRIAAGPGCAFTVDHVNIYKSVLAPRGAQYTVLERLDLI